MSKRFTDTAKWQDQWFRSMPVEMKEFWHYICDVCDHAGLWKVDLGLASFQIGAEIDLATIRRWFFESEPPRLQEVTRELWWIIKFCAFQYGNLETGKPAVVSAVRRLQEFDLITRLPGAAHHPAQSGHQSIPKTEPDGIPNSLPPEPAQARAGKKVSKPEYNLADYPALNTPEFAAAFEEWLAYRKRIKHTVNDPGATLKRLVPFGAKWAIERFGQCQANSWRGVIFKDDKPPTKAIGTPPALEPYLQWETFAEGCSAPYAALLKGMVCAGVRDGELKLIAPSDEDAEALFDNHYDAMRRDLALFSQDKITCFSIDVEAREEVATAEE